MVCVCVPFFVLIVLLQTHNSMRLLRKACSAVEGLFSGGRNRGRREMLAAKQMEAAVAAVAQGRRQLDDRLRGLGGRRWRRRVEMADAAGDGERRPWWRIRRKRAVAFERGRGDGVGDV